MNTTPMTNTHCAPGVIGAGRSSAIAGLVSAVGGAAGRWPWPLPANSVLAVFDDRAAALKARTALFDAGIGADVVWQVSGEAGARWLREAYRRRSAPARLLSLLGDEPELLAHLETLSLRGAVVMLVQASPGQAAEVPATMLDHNARAVRRTGRWLTEWHTRSAADRRRGPRPGGEATVSS